MEYKYCNIEDNISQYEVNPDCNIYDARYVKANLDIDKGNPFIEALPLPVDNVAVVYDKGLLGYRRSEIAKMNYVEKVLAVSSLRNLRFILPFDKELDVAFYTSLVQSYRNRKMKLVRGSKAPMLHINGEDIPCKAIVEGDAAAATFGNFCLIGVGGSGKSAAINMMLSRYPQVIKHKLDAGGYFIQVTYLCVNCTPNSNFTAMYEAIGDALDRALGNYVPFFGELVRKTQGGVQGKGRFIKQLIQNFCIGSIIFDEVQLLNFSHIKDNTFDNLLTLANDTKLAMIVVGTEEARDKMFHEIHTVRRIGRIINSDLYCRNRKTFDMLVQRLFKYQWFDEFVEPTPEITEALYSVSYGIIDQLICIYICVHYEYLKIKQGGKKSLVIDSEFIVKTANKYYPSIQHILANVFDDPKSYAAVKYKGDMKAASVLDEAMQIINAEAINKEVGELDKNIDLLNMVIANIQKVSDYSVDEISSAYTMITKKKGSKHDETSITKAVMLYLNKSTEQRKRTVDYAKLSVEELKEMAGLE